MSSEFRVCLFLDGWMGGWEGWRLLGPGASCILGVKDGGDEDFRSWLTVGQKRQKVDLLLQQ